MMFITEKLLIKLNFEKIEETNADVSFLRYKKGVIEVTLLWQFNKFEVLEANKPYVAVYINGAKTRICTEVELKIQLVLIYEPFIEKKMNTLSIKQKEITEENIQELGYKLVGITATHQHNQLTYKHANKMVVRFRNCIVGDFKEEVLVSLERDNAAPVNMDHIKDFNTLLRNTQFFK